MKWALVNNTRIEATSKALGFCQLCKSEMRGYDGSLQINHWKHVSNANCDSWHENETEWHREWKNKFPEEWQEKLRENETNKHFADVFNPDKELVIEFQNSSLSVGELHQRERFYNKMIWVVNAIPYIKNISLEKSWHHYFTERIINPIEKQYSRIMISFYKVVGRLLKIYWLNLDGAHIYSSLQIEEIASMLENDMRKKFKDSIWELFSMILTYDELKIKVSELVENLFFNYSKYHELKKLHVEIHGLEANLIKKYRNKSFNEIDDKSDYFFFDWKHQHKHWNFAEKPIFLDTGNSNIYRVVEVLRYGNGFIVRRYDKADFLSYYLK
jgi:hypothetical protein